MKKIMLLIFGCTMLTTVHAQSTFGLKLAYNRTTATSPVNYADTRGIDRIQLGIFGKLDLYKHFFVKGNLTYNQKGNHYSDLYYMADAGKSVDIKLNYLEASADLGYAIKLIGKHKILLGAGPYLAYGLNGTEKGKMETIAGMRDFNRKVKYTNSDYNDGTKLQIKPIDFGLNFNVGYQYRKYGLFFNYGLGLTNRENLAYSYNSYNRVASVGISYSFR